MDINGRVILITGASAGIGEAAARLLADSGARLALVARRADRLGALAAELPGALAIGADLRDAAQITRAVAETVDAFGRVDVLVNNAGQGLHVPLDQVRLADLIAITELNVYAPLLAMQAVLPVMRAQRSGAIVTVSSATSRTVLPGLSAYSATKSAVNMLSAVARAEFADDGIVVSTVYPTATETEFHDRLAAGERLSNTGLTVHTAQYVAQAIAYAIRSGEGEVIIPRGPEQPGLFVEAVTG
jgi:short-subunit dehydrogenase